MALNTAAFATGVSKLKLTGVRIRDQDEIPIQVYDPDAATLVDRLGIAGDARVVDGKIEVTLPARSGAVFAAR